MLLNMGPQHPSTHGVINLLVESDGEVITRASSPRSVTSTVPLKRSVKSVTYNGFMPYTDRVDYVAAMTANEGYAMVVERLLGITDLVPRRALLLPGHRERTLPDRLAPRLHGYHGDGRRRR
jgi:NADH-quinone oxidoreductase subunit D